MTNTVCSPDGELRCSCGAKCADSNKRKRFLARHPGRCSERLDLAKQLAQGTRSVESNGFTYEGLEAVASVTINIMVDTEETLDIRHQIAVVNAEGRNLTPWEEEFMESITQQFHEQASLTIRQQEILGRIYGDRT